MHQRLRPVPTRNSFPEPMEIHRPQRPIVEPVARLTCLAPDHPSVIGAYRSIEAGLVQSRDHRTHVDVADSRRMRGLLKRALPGSLDVAEMHKVNSAFRPNGAHYGSEVVSRIG